MTTTDPSILEKVQAEMKGNEPAPTPEPEPVVEENKPTPKPEEKKPEEPSVEDKKPDAKADDVPNVELDKKFVSYARFKDINEKYKALKSEKEESVKNRKPIEMDDDTKEEAERLRKLGFATKEDQEDQRFQIKQEQLKQEEQAILDKEFNKLERDFDWSDWLPKFSKDDVMNRGIENQVFDPKSAYIVMNLDKIINHFVKKAMVDVKKTPTFGKSNDVRQPDITPKDKSVLKGQTLTKFLTEKIEGMMGGN